MIVLNILFRKAIAKLLVIVPFLKILILAKDFVCSWKS